MASLDVSNLRCFHARSLMGITRIEQIYFLRVYPTLIVFGLIGNTITLLAIIINIFKQRRSVRLHNRGPTNSIAIRMGLKARIIIACRRVFYKMPLLPLNQSISIKDLESMGTTSTSHHHYFGSASSSETILGPKVFSLSLFIVNILLLCLLSVDPVFKYYVRGQVDSPYYRNIWFGLVWNDFEANYHHPMVQTMISISFLLSVLISFYTYARSLNPNHFYVSFFTTRNCQLLVLGCVLCSLIMFAPTTFWYKIVEGRLCKEPQQKYQSRSKRHLEESMEVSNHSYANSSGTISLKSRMLGSKDFFTDYPKSLFSSLNLSTPWNQDTAYIEISYKSFGSDREIFKDTNMIHIFVNKFISRLKRASVPRTELTKFHLTVNNSFKYKNVIWLIYQTLRETLTKIAPMAYLIYINIKLARTRKRYVLREGLIDSLSYISDTHSDIMQIRSRNIKKDKTYSTTDVRIDKATNMVKISGNDAHYNKVHPMIRSLNPNVMEAAEQELSVSTTRLMNSGSYRWKKQGKVLMNATRKVHITDKPQASPALTKFRSLKLPRESSVAVKGDILLTLGTYVILFQAIVFILPPTIMNLFWDYVYKLSLYDIIKVDIAYELCYVLYVSLTFYLAMIFCTKFRRLVFGSFH